MLSSRFIFLVSIVVVMNFAHRAAADAFSARAENYLHLIAERKQGPSFSIITAQLKTKTHVAEALAQLDTLLQSPSGDMFYMYPCIGCLMNCRDALTPELRARFRDVWKTYTFYRGDTENHFLMYYASLFLAAEEWPGLAGAEWFNGKSSDENLFDARDYLLHWSDDVARLGLVEFDSPRYFYYQITPLILLREFSRDTLMRTRAEMLLDYFFADFASEYLNGNYCGAHSRDVESSTIAPRTAEAISYAGLYFGDVDVAQPLQDVAFAALSSYRLSEIIRAIAIDKPNALVHRETRRARTHIRFGGDPQPPVFKYDFMTPDFCLGSLNGSIAQPIQQRSWSLIFNSAKPNNRIFALHPSYSAHEVGMFFPEEQQLLVSEIAKSKAGYGSEDKWIGGSFSERIVQEKNVMIALYDIPADDPVGHIDYFIPTDLDSIERDSSGWIFFKEGASYAAIFPLRAYSWRPEGNHIRLRSYSRRNGYIVVAGSQHLKPQIKNFSLFKNEVRHASPDTSAFAAHCEVVIKIGNRAPLWFNYNEPPPQDSALFADSEFSFLRSKGTRAPHLSCVRGSGVIEISRPGETLELDFKSNEIRIVDGER